MYAKEGNGVRILCVCTWTCMLLWWILKSLGAYDINVENILTLFLSVQLNCIFLFDVFKKLTLNFFNDLSCDAIVTYIFALINMVNDDRRKEVLPIMATTWNS